MANTEAAAHHLHILKERRERNMVRRSMAFHMPCLSFSDKVGSPKAICFRNKSEEAKLSNVSFPIF